MNKEEAIKKFADDPEFMDGIRKQEESLKQTMIQEVGRELNEKEIKIWDAAVRACIKVCVRLRHFPGPYITDMEQLSSEWYSWVEDEEFMKSLDD